LNRQGHGEWNCSCWVLSGRRRGVGRYLGSLEKVNPGSVSTKETCWSPQQNHRAATIRGWSGTVRIFRPPLLNGKRLSCKKTKGSTGSVSRFITNRLRAIVETWATLNFSRIQTHSKPLLPQTDLALNVIALPLIVKGLALLFNSKHGIPFGASEPWRPPNHAMAQANDSIGPGFIDLNRLMPPSILERD